MSLGFVYLALTAMDQATAAFEGTLCLETTFAEGYYWLGRIDYLQRM